MIRPLTVLALSLSTVAAAEPRKRAFTHFVPPPPPAAPVAVPDAHPMHTPRTTLWSIGAPTDQEQYYLELINRARMNPSAEGARLAALTDPDVLANYDYFNVNLNQMRNEMNALTPKAPLAMNAKLLVSSRRHSNDQFNMAEQSHTGSDGSTIGTRLADAGYSASYYAENVFAFSKSSMFGHTAFEVDWGYGSGGMQEDRGHRAIIHAGFREVGIGIREGVNGSGSDAVGPQVVTQDFGVPSGPAVPLVTGVAYYDFNGNAFYDPGEGIGGVTVNVDGSSWHAVTAASGGYAVPVPSGAASRTVTFSGLGFNTTATASLPDTNNTKVDLKPTYAPPHVSGPASPVSGAGNAFSLSAVNGATSYDWRAMRRTPAAADGANDLTRVTAAVSGYNVLSTAVKQEGTASYHLAQPNGTSQTITCNTAFRAGAAPVLQYQSRLAQATTSQKAYVQVSTDGGLTWITVETQTGTGGSGQGSFSLRTVPLTAVAGRDFLLRFNFALAGTSYYTSTGNSTGWFLDAITFSDVLDTTGAAVTAMPSGTAFTFTPSGTGTWLLSGRPVVSGRALGFGPLLEVNAVSGPPDTFALWAAQVEAAAGLPAGTIAGSPAADYNRDRVPNLMACALNLSAVNSAAAALPAPVVTAGMLRIDYSRAAGIADIALTPQISTDLQTWFTPGQAGAPAGFTDTLLSTAGTMENRRASVPVTPGAEYFLRLRATKL